MVQLQRIMKLMLSIALVTVFLGCASTSQKRESPGQYVDDSVVTSKVKTAIMQEPTLKVLQINVKTYQGKVQLSGFVDSQESIKKAGEVAKNVEGAATVENDLIVK